MMKSKFSKISVLFMVLGLSIMLAAFILNGFSLENIEVSKNYESYTLLYTEPINKIELLDTKGKVQFKPSSDGSTSLELYKNKENHFDVQLENGVLHIKLEKKSSFFDIFSFLQKKPPSIYLSVPENINLQFSTTNGQLQVQNLSLSNLQIKLINGKVELNSLTLKELTIESTNAKLDAKNINIAQTGNIQSENATQNLKNILAQTLQVQNKNGKIEGRSLSAKQMQVQNTNGKISLNDVEIEELLQASNTNGKIALSLPGQSQDYNIKVNSRNKNHQRWNSNNNASKTVELSLGNGNLNLEFEGN